MKNIEREKEIIESLEVVIGGGISERHMIQWLAGVISHMNDKLNEILGDTYTKEELEDEI